jgi:hypothetical protein
VCVCVCVFCPNGCFLGAKQVFIRHIFGIKKLKVKVTKKKIIYGYGIRQTIKLFFFYLCCSGQTCV